LVIIHKVGNPNHYLKKLANLDFFTNLATWVLFAELITLVIIFKFATLVIVCKVGNPGNYKQKWQTW